MRRSTLEDAELLFTWRNHPTTRAMSLDPAELSWESHVQWLTAAVADPDRLLLIGEWQGTPVGQVRFDLRGEEAEVSVSVGPEYRSRGFGRCLIEEGSRWLGSRHRVATILAVIRPENAASKKVFAGCGFVYRNRTEVRGVVSERWVRECVTEANG